MWLIPFHGGISPNNQRKCSIRKSCDSYECFIVSTNETKDTNVFDIICNKLVLRPLNRCWENFGSIMNVTRLFRINARTRARKKGQPFWFDELLWLLNAIVESHFCWLGWSICLFVVFLLDLATNNTQHSFLIVSYYRSNDASVFPKSTFRLNDNYILCLRYLDEFQCFLKAFISNYAVDHVFYGSKNSTKSLNEKKKKNNDKMNWSRRSWR